MEIDFAPSHNPSLFGALSVSPPASMFESFSPLLHFNDDFLDVFNSTKTTDDDDVDDWMKPLLFDQFLEHELQQNIFNFNDIDLKPEGEDEDKSNQTSSVLTDMLNTYSLSQHAHIDNDLIDIFHLQPSSEQQLPTTTTTTVRVIHQPKIEPTEIPTTVYVTGNELQFHPIVTTTNHSLNHGNTISHAYTTPTSPTIPIVPARVLKGKKFKRGGRVTSRATSRSGANSKRRLNSIAAEPKASVVIIAEDATRIDSKTTTLGLSSVNANDTDLLKSSATTTTSTRSSTRRRVKSTPREVILFRNGTFVSKEPISKQQPTTTLCYETAATASGTCPSSALQQQQQQLTATGLQAAAQLVACNVLRQATINDALIEQLIKREPNHSDEDYPIYCYSSPSLSSSSSACPLTAAIDEYETSCSTTLKILGCNTATPLTPANTTTTTTIELLTFAALQQQQQQQQQHHQQQQFCYIKQEPITTTTTTTTFLLPRLLPQSM